MATLGCGARLAVALFCATGASCSTAATQAPNFSGSWAYQQKCDPGHTVNVLIKQTGSQATGEWSEGTNVSGQDGLLKGEVRGDKLFVRYCATDGTDPKAACPTYDVRQDYFAVRNGAIVRYQKYGATYKEDVALHRDDAGKSVPVDITKCYDKED